MTGCEADRHFMRQALAEAAKAAAAGEVPVGAVVVHQGRIVGRGHNRSVGRQDVSAHAEIEAIRAASRALGNYRLDDCTLYVSLEPCVMCSGAVLGARLARLVYGASEPKTGAAGSVLDVFAHARLNHHTRVEGGLLADECGAVLQAFFQARRSEQQGARSQNFLREDALRAPEGCRPAWPAGLRSEHLGDVPGLDGLRLHVLRAGEGGPAVLALHGPGQWSAAYAASAPALAACGLSLWAPDLPGFGLSDKPKKTAWHTLAVHAELLRALAARLPGPTFALVFPPSARALAAGLLTDAATASRLACAACIDEPALPPGWDALPYPDAGHRSGPRALPGLLTAAEPAALPTAVRLRGHDWPAQLAARLGGT